MFGFKSLHLSQKLSLKKMSSIRCITVIDFSSREIAGKTLSVRKNITGNINLGQTSHLNLDKFGTGNDIPD